MVEKFDSLGTTVDQHKGNSGAKRKHMSNICPHCGFVATKSGQIRVHMRKNSEPSTHKLVTANSCLKLVLAVIKLMLVTGPRKRHGEVKECGECGKQTRELASHMRLAHTPESERKYKCSFCGKGFVCRQKLEQHEVIHSDARPYPCKYDCGYTCKTPGGNLAKHEKICATKQPV